MHYLLHLCYHLQLEASEIHHQIMWIEAIGLKGGVLADPLSVIMANVVAWISFLIMIYSTGYMKGDKDITRFWFWMMFFIGSMQLIVLSDNLLQVFFGWEGVGLASYALISFWYRDKKKDHVGQEGRTVLGLARLLCTNTCWYEGIHHDQSWRCDDDCRYAFDILVCWNIWI